MRRRAQPDPVTPETYRYVLARDRRCLVGWLADRGDIPFSLVGLCASAEGTIRDPRTIDGLDPTVAHVRDRGKGGRTGKRPPSVPRHLATVCYRHHLGGPVVYVDLPEVRDALDAHLEEIEGPDPEDGRAHERIRRVRGPAERMLPDGAASGDRTGAAPLPKDEP
jgi:hypothetical protein